MGEAFTTADAATPIWRRIRDALEVEIADGRYPPGSNLPSEAAMAARFAVNRHTVRRALADLRGAGLLDTRRGVGAVVTNRTRAPYPLGRVTRFTANVQRAGGVAEHRIIRLETGPMSAAEADALSAEAGEPAHLVATLGLADATPLVYAESVLPKRGLEGFPAAMRQRNSKTKALEACGLVGLTRRRTEITAEAASALVARHLRLPEGAPVLRTEGLDVAPDGRPVEWGVGWFAADRVALIVDPVDF